MLTDTERQATIERIAGHLERFDDATLQEMARLTDPASREVRPPAPPAALTRRQVLIGFAAGAGTVGAAAMGITRAREAAAPAPGTAAADSAWQTLAAQLQDEGPDGQLAAGLAAVGAALAEAREASAALSTGLQDVGPAAEAAVLLVEPDLGPRLRDGVVLPAGALTVALDAALEAWATALERPLAAELDRRSALRREMDRLGR
jgi:hypothetical protein